MANLLSRLFRKGEISRSLTVSEYLRLLTNQFGGYYMPPSFAYSAAGKPAERLPGTFEQYVTNLYAANPIVFGLMNKRLAVFSEARFCWREIVDDGKPGDTFFDDNLALLEKPWPGGTTGSLLSRMIQDVDLSGNAYVVREKDRLRRLRPDWVQIVLTGDPMTEQKVDVLGYAYSPGGPDVGPIEVFEPDEVAHWAPIPDPLAAFRGMSWLTPVIREVEADQAATQHKMRFLRKGAVLGPIVKAPPGLSAEQFKRFVEAFEAAHGGVDKSFATVYLAGGSDVTMSMADFRQLDMKNVTGSAETRLCVAAGVPAVIAGVSEGLQGSSLNAGNYSAAKRSWADGGLRPLWRSACAALANIIPAPDNGSLWFHEQDIAFLREDQQDLASIGQTRGATINAYVTSGWTPDSAIAAVVNDDPTLLKHTGLLSVQMQPPGEGEEPKPGEAESGAEGGQGNAPSGEKSGSEGESAEPEVTNTEAESEAEQSAARARIQRADLPHTGAMIALVPSAGDAERLALPGGEPAEDLHLTLFYLGEAADIPEAVREALVNAVRTMVQRRELPVVEGNVFGAALWNPTAPDPAWVLNVGDAKDRPEGQESLAAVRAMVDEAWHDGGVDFDLPEQHTPWQPHICVAYGADSAAAEELADRMGQVTFDRIRVAFAGENIDIPLGDEAFRAELLNLLRAAGVVDKHGHLHAPAGTSIGGQFVRRILKGDLPSDRPDPSANVSRKTKLAGEMLDDLDDSDVRQDVHRVFGGTYAGLEVRVGRLDGDEGGMEVAFTIHDATGAEVGKGRRVVARDESGNLYAQHKLLELGPSVRGQGFATEFNAALEDWYRESGVERIELHADIDVGGFAWARQGYDWRDGRVPDKIRSLVESLAPKRYDRTDFDMVDAEDLSPQTREHLGVPDGGVVVYGPGGRLVGAFETRYDGLLGMDEAITELNPVDDFTDILERLEAGIPVSPYEISQIGWEPGMSGPDATWPGKEILLGSDWYGVKWL